MAQLEVRVGGGDVPTPPQQFLPNFGTSSHNNNAVAVLPCQVERADITEYLA